MIKSATVTVPATWGAPPYRDAGKTFRITEMPALQAEKWGIRAWIALKGTAGFISEDYIDELGMIGVAIDGINAFLASPISFTELEPLLDEMMTCVAIVREPAKHPDVVTALTSLDIEEVRTLLWLRSEVLNLHTGFSIAAALFALAEKLKTAPGVSQST